MAPTSLVRTTTGSSRSSFTYIFYSLIVSVLCLWPGGVSAGRLTEKWNMEGPQVMWDQGKDPESSNHSFFLEYIVTDAIKYPKYQIYQKNCKALHPKPDQLLELESTSLQLIPDAEHAKNQKLLIELAPKYHRKQPVEFCVRVSLWTGPNNAENDEVNFREVDLAVTVAQQKDKTIHIKDVQMAPMELHYVGVQLQGKSARCGSPGCETQTK